MEVFSLMRTSGQARPGYILCAVGFVVWSAWVVAAEAAAESPATRNYLQRAYTKIRPGSMLRGENGAPIPPMPELRSTAAKRRDQSVVKHFARLAELDVVDDLAEKRKDVSLQENVEEVRRKEMERFHMLMQGLRGLSWRTWLGELP